MIHVSNLNKTYKHFDVLKDVSFSIASHEIVGFLGPNGAGKTTLIKILLGLIPSDSGNISINGLNHFKNHLEIKRNIGFLSEDNSLYPDMTVIEYLKFIAQARQIKNLLIDESIDFIINACQLNEKIDAKIEHCSKGFKQRLGIAQAIIHKPKLIILDEPTSGLDPNQLLDIRHLIKSLKSESTILLCSHLLTEVMETCSRVMVLNKGEIVANEHIDVINKSNHKEIYLETSMPPEILEKKLKTLQNTVTILSFNAEDHVYIYTLQSDEDCREELFNLISKSNYSIKEMSSKAMSLEVFFTKLTKEK